MLGIIKSDVIFLPLCEWMRKRRQSEKDTNIRDGEKKILCEREK